MNEIKQSEIDFDECDRCGAEVKMSEKYCTKCGHPQHASDEEIDAYYDRIKEKEDALYYAKKEIDSASTTLFVVGGIVVLFGIIVSIMKSDGIGAIMSVLIGLIYVGLGFYTDKKPLIAVLSGLILYITLQVVAAFVNPASIFSGIIFKVIIIGALIRGVNNARKAEALRKELDQISAINY